MTSEQTAHPLPEQPEAEAVTEPFHAEPHATETAHGPSAEETELREENAKLRDQLLRSMAEMENVRRRAQRDAEEGAKYAVTGFARDLINVVENLQRASTILPEEVRAENETYKSLGEGVDMTMRELLAAFEKHGIRRIDPLGEKFDHNFHQAVIQIEDPNQEPGTVLQVLQAGYVLHDRLLRPAMVAVSKRGEEARKIDTTA
jgi:molecular chaperone GrpE